MTQCPIEETLSSLGYTLPQAPPPAAIYLPYQRVGDQLWIAGQIATHEGQLLHQGRVGIEVSLEEAQRCAEVCLLNLLSQVKLATGNLADIEQVVKLNVFVSSASSFTDQHLVANGASELLGAVLGERGRHARAAVGVSTLPLNSPVEIDAVFQVRAARGSVTR